MMWSAVCSGSPHSHAALSASPHFFMEALYRPTPVRSLFREGMGGNEVGEGGRGGRERGREEGEGRKGGDG